LNLSDFFFPLHFAGFPDRNLFFVDGLLHKYRKPVFEKATKYGKYRWEIVAHLIVFAISMKVGRAEE